MLDDDAFVYNSRYSCYDHLTVYDKIPREDYLERYREHVIEESFTELQQRIIDLPYESTNYDSEEVVD